MRFRAAFLVLFALVPVAGFAQLRTFVSSTGVDTNPCTRGLPCRGFGAAAAAVVTGGEVIALDSAGYGPATITKSVSITAPAGVYAGVTVTSGDGFLLNAPAAVINVSGITFTGLGGTFGINQASVPAELNVSNCTFAEFSGGGGAGVNASGLLRATVRDSVFRSNVTGVGIGGTAISIDHCRFDFNTTGVASTESHLILRDNIFIGGTTGLSMTALVSAVATLENCMFSEMTDGITAAGIQNGTATVRLSATTIVNTTVAMNGPGNFVSFGNNRFAGNTLDGTFSSTIPLK